MNTYVRANLRDIRIEPYYQLIFSEFDEVYEYEVKFWKSEVLKKLHFPISVCISGWW